MKTTMEGEIACMTRQQNGTCGADLGLVTWTCVSTLLLLLKLCVDVWYMIIIKFGVTAKRRKHGYLSCTVVSGVGYGCGRWRWATVWLAFEFLMMVAAI